MSQTAAEKPTKRSAASAGRITIDFGEDVVAALIQARDRENRDTLTNMVRAAIKEWLAGKYPDLAAELDRRASA